MVEINKIPLKWYEGTEILVKTYQRVYGNSRYGWYWRKVQDVRIVNGEIVALFNEAWRSETGRTAVNVEEIASWCAPHWAPEEANKDPNGHDADVIGSPIKMRKPRRKR